MTATLDADVLQQLVTGAQRGDRVAADALIREHDGWVRSIIYGVVGRPDLIDDIAQQVWTQVWTRLSSLKDPKRLRPWLYTIARNAAIDGGMAHRRARLRNGRLEPVAETRADDRASDPAGRVSRNELYETLLQAIQGLPMIYREPFALRHLEGWSYAEIGEVLQMPLETVETRLVRARRLLREGLTNRMEDE